MDDRPRSPLWWTPNGIKTPIHRLTTTIFVMQTPLIQLPSGGVVPCPSAYDDFRPRYAKGLAQ